MLAKRRRIRGKQSDPSSKSEDVHYSYACSWERYIDGNVVSETSRKYITNMLVATASAKIDDPFNSSDESDEEQWKDCTSAAASMQLVQRTLNGISARNAEDGQRAFGRHASTIRMGRALWQTPPLQPNEQHGIAETFFDDGSLPPLKECKAAFDAGKKRTRATSSF